MVKITLLVASVAALAATVMAQADNATPTPAPTPLAKRDRDLDAIFSSYFNDPNGIQQHLSRASERLNHLPSEARASAQSRIAEASRSIANIRPTDRDGKDKTPTPAPTSPDAAAATPSATGAAVAADNKASSGNVNMPFGAVAAAVGAAIAVGALM